MTDVQIPTFRASFNIDGFDATLIGTPVTVTVPSRTGVGTSQATGIVAEIHDDYIVVEFIA